MAFQLSAIAGFLGSTCLKQALIDLSEDASPLQSPATDENCAWVTAPLRDFIAELTPTPWCRCRAYPQTGLRLISPGIAGWAQPPDLLIVQDPWGLAFKDVSFLLLITLAVVRQADAAGGLTVAPALDYGRTSGWLKAIFSRIYAQIRLPVDVVLAHSVCVVDVAVILGPDTSPTLGVQITRWMSDPDPSFRLQAALGALVKLDRVVQSVGLCAATLISGASLCGLLGLGQRSVAGYWSFPNLPPDAFPLWSWGGIWRALWMTAFAVGFAVSVGQYLPTLLFPH